MDIVVDVVVVCFVPVLALDELVVGRLDVLEKWAAWWPQWPGWSWSRTGSTSPFAQLMIPDRRRRSHQRHHSLDDVLGFGAAPIAAPGWSR